MQQYRFYHTLWTLPLTEDKVYVTQLCYALSYTFLKRMGGQVVIHTDKRGAELLSFIPYDEVIIDLDDIDKRYSTFWAYGKLVATSREPLGSIHIDGDVFFFNKDLVSAFSLDCDVFVQNYEGPDRRLHNCYEQTQAVIGADYPEWMDVNYNKSYNCGIVKFNNEMLKQLYITTYFYIVEKCLSDPLFQYRLAPEGIKYGGVIPDIVAEQQTLHELCTKYNKSVGVLLPDGCDQGEYANRVGYCHLCTGIKYTMVEGLENDLELNAPELLEKLKK